ncbi:MAG: ABC transporter substrate-binding protein [Prevotella sp.]|nr:ABC transporter substrate-binding protein [Prevotella sp.]
MRKLFLFIAVILLAACSGSGSSEDKTTVADSARWHIAVLPTMDCLPLMLAQDRGFFDDEGVSVGLQLFQSQMDVDTALLGGSAQAAATDLARVMHLRQQGLHLCCVSATDAAWQLVSMRPARISKLAQLDDKMLAMTRYSATDLLSDLVVDSAGLKPERVFRIQINDLNVRLGMLQSGIMDAMFLPEPQSMLARDHRAQLLYDTRRADLWLGCLAFVGDSAMKQQSDVKAILRAYDRAVDSLNQRGLAAYADLLASQLRLSAAAVDSLSSQPPFRHSHEPRQVDVTRASSWWEKRVASMKYVEKRYIQ